LTSESTNKSSLKYNKNYSNFKLSKINLSYRSFSENNSSNIGNIDTQTNSSNNEIIEQHKGCLTAEKKQHNSLNENNIENIINHTNIKEKDWSNEIYFYESNDREEYLKMCLSAKTTSSFNNGSSNKKEQQLKYDMCKKYSLDKVEKVEENKEVDDINTIFSTFDKINNMYSKITLWDTKYLFATHTFINVQIKNVRKNGKSTKHII
jgi:hypothetical protein